MHKVTNESASIIIYKACLEGKKAVCNHFSTGFACAFAELTTKIHLIINCIFLSLILFPLPFPFIND